MNIMKDDYKPGFVGKDEMRNKAEHMLHGELGHSSIYEHQMNGEHGGMHHHNYEANMRGEHPVAKTQKRGEKA
jgi:hypothetical protein